MTGCDKAVALGQGLFFQSYYVHLSCHLCFFYHDMASFVRFFFFSLSVTPTAREKGANPLNLQAFLHSFCLKCNLIFM